MLPISTERRTTSESEDGGALASNRMTNSLNEFDWVAAAKTVASGAAGVFNCANDTTEFKDEFFDNGELLSPTMMCTRGARRQRSERHIPYNTGDGDDTELTPDLERATRDIDAEAIGGMSTLTPLSANPLPPTMEPSVKATETNTWDELYATNENNLPDERDDDRIVLNDDSQKSLHAPDNNKKRRITVGAIVLLAVVLLAVGVVVPLVLGRTGSSSAEQNDFIYSNANAGESDIGDGDNLHIPPSPLPTSSYAPTEGVEQTTNDENTNDESQYTPIFLDISTSTLHPTPSVSESPISHAQHSNVPVTTTVPPTQSTIMASSRPTSSGNEPAPSSTSLSWEEGLFSDDPPTIGKTSTPTSAAIEPTESPSVRPSTPNPTSSAAMKNPSLRPATVKPSSLSITSSPSTESPITGQPATFELTEATPEPTPSTERPITGQPTSLAPTVTTPKPTLSTESPTTDQPISLAPTVTTPKPTRSPTSLAPTDATPNPTRSTAAFAANDEAPELNFSQPTESRLTIELQTDKHGDETSWTLYSVDPDTNAQITVVATKEENTYQPFEQDSIELSLNPGKYRFTLKDAYGDGFCCSNGSDGSYAISIDGRELIRGGFYRFEVSHDILVRTEAELTMSDRDKEWLEAHNSRRKIWHERHDKTYVPLHWSKSLAADAFSWAEELLGDCDIPGISHESNVSEGENLAKAVSSTVGFMGQFYPPENMLKRWVDQEETWGYPKNAHLTQALWRASRYVGCGDAVKNYNDGSICRVQVCRYATSGNCAMGSFDAKEGDNWLAPMLMERSGCGPDCPPEGCF